MATVTKPLALDESINTTEQTPRNVADVLAQGLDAIEQAIAGGGGGGGGHTIVNASGTDMTQRAKMQFVDAGVTDDSANNKTKVEVVQLIDDEDELTNAPDGVYQGDYDDAPEDVLDASMVAYKDGSVEDALDVKTYTVTQHDHSSDVLSGVTVTVQKCNAKSIGNLGIVGINLMLSSSITMTAWTSVILMDIADWGFSSMAWLDDYAPLFDPSGNVVGWLAITGDGTTGQLQLLSLSEQKTLPASKYLCGQVVHIFE